MKVTPIKYDGTTAFIQADRKGNDSLSKICGCLHKEEAELLKATPMSAESAFRYLL